ncbi:MAG: DUF4129 domain-containing protein [Chloroflexi bacterium]|nr:DUF4129 domain-containing protein [Chloroflexota bacterium]
MPANLRLRYEVLFVLVAALELGWFFTWLELLAGGMGGATGHFSWMSCLLLMLAAVYVTRWLESSPLELKEARWVMALTFIITTSLYAYVNVYSRAYAWYDWHWFLAIFQEIVHLLEGPGLGILAVGSSLYLWWRSIVITEQRLSLTWVGLHFRLGILAFALALIVSAASLRLSFGIHVVVYFATGLAAIAIARTTEVTENIEGSATPFGLSWLLILAGATGIVLLIGLIVAQLLSLDVTRELLWLAAPVWLAFGFLAYVLIALIAVPLQWLVLQVLAVIQEMVQRIQMRLPDLTNTPLNSENIQHLIDRLRQFLPPAIVFDVTRWGTSIGLIALAVLGLVYLFNHTRRRRIRSTTEVRESISVRTALLEDLASLKAWQQQVWQQFRSGHSLWGEADGAPQTIHQLYTRLLRLGEHLGTPRRQAETPYEYIPDLAETLPEQQPGIETITEIFVRAHYGAQEPTPAEFSVARQRYAEIRAMASSLAKRRKKSSKDLG